MRSKLLNETFTTLRVSITAIHKAMDESIFDAIFFRYITEFEQMVKRAVYTTIGSQSHEVDIFTIFFGIRESRNDFRILHNAVVGTSSVDFHQILINNTSGTDIEMTYFRVAHLSVGQTYILTTSLQL